MKYKAFIFLGVILFFDTSSLKSVGFRCSGYHRGQKQGKAKKIRQLILENRKSIALATTGVCSGMNAISAAGSMSPHELKVFGFSAFTIVYFLYLVGHKV